MKSSLCVLVVVLLLEGVFCSVSQQPLPPNPDHPDQCYDPETNEAHDVGDTWYKPGECVQYSCEKADDGFLIQSIGCAAVAPPDPPCTVVEDVTKQHPDCCPKIEC